MVIKVPHAQYWEGILQAREVTEEQVEHIIDIVKHDERAAVTQIKKVPHGWDLYFSSQHYLRALAKKLATQFGGTIKVSATLHTRDRTGKDLYRITVLWRPHPFKKGDTVNIAGEPWTILHIGNQINLQHQGSGKKQRMKVSEFTSYTRSHGNF